MYHLDFLSNALYKLKKQDAFIIFLCHNFDHYRFNMLFIMIILFAIIVFEGGITYGYRLGSFLGNLPNFLFYEYHLF